MFYTNVVDEDYVIEPPVQYVIVPMLGGTRDVTITLPDVALYKGNFVSVQRITLTAYDPIVQRSGIALIDGLVSVTLRIGFRLEVFSDGIQWRVTFISD
jgi:hypothetical protein